MLLPGRALPLPSHHPDGGPARVRTRTPRVLVVGAYERDNFGDLLFLLVTERYLAEAEVVAAAPFAADMTALLDRRIHAYGPLLQRAVGGAPVVSPYIPATTAHPRNAGAVTVLDSAGLSGIAALEPARRDALVALLRSRTHIAVRDRASSRFLTSVGIDHRLAPDAVHAAAILWPGERDRESDVAVFQASSAILAQLGHANVAAALAASRRLKGLKLRLLLAGTATGHDAVADYERVVAGVRRAAPGTDIEILEARRPLELVTHLRGARVVIGTSLHVRIVAGAYGVARVTLRRSKPTRYARTWDARMPFDVPLTRLDPAIDAALARAERPGAAAASAELARLAHENLADLAGRALAPR